MNSCRIDVAGDNLHPLFEESRAVIASPIVHFRNVGLVVIHTFALVLRMSCSVHAGVNRERDQRHPLKSTIRAYSVGGKSCVHRSVYVVFRVPEGFWPPLQVSVVH